MGTCFKNYALFPTRTVKDNICAGYRGEEGQREEKARDFMKRYQLEGLEKPLSITTFRWTAAESCSGKNDDR